MESYTQTESIFQTLSRINLFVPVHGINVYNSISILLSAGLATHQTFHVNIIIIPTLPVNKLTRI